MVSSEIARSLRRFSSAIDFSHPLPKQLEALVKQWKILLAGTGDVVQATSAGQAWDYTQGIKSSLKTAIDVIRSLRSSQFNSEIRRIHSAVDDLEILPRSASRLEQYRKQLKDLQDAHDELLHVAYSYGAIFSFLAAANSLAQILATDRETLAFIADQLQPPPLLQEGEDELSLYFDGELSLEEIAEKLQGVAEAFSAVADAIDQPATYRVVKVETGTIEITIAGTAAVLWVLRPLIRDAARVIWQRLTWDGQQEIRIAAIVAAWRTQAGVIDELASRGVDTDKLERLHSTDGGRIVSGISKLLKKSLPRVDGERLPENRELSGPPNRMLPPPATK